MSEPRSVELCEECGHPLWCGTCGHSVAEIEIVSAAEKRVADAVLGLEDVTYNGRAVKITFPTARESAEFMFALGDLRKLKRES